MNRLIIGISGRKQSGKSTFAMQTALEYLRQHQPDAAEGLYINKCGKLQPWGDLAAAELGEYGVAVLSLADPIKAFCRDVLGLTHEQVDGADAGKNSLTPICWPGTGAQMTGREVMQFFGTDMMRWWIPDVWVSCLMRRIAASSDPLVLVPDVRFANEAEALQLAGALLVRLERGPFADGHASENGEIPRDMFDMLVPPDLDGVAAQWRHVERVVGAWIACMEEPA